MFPRFQLLRRYRGFRLGEISPVYRLPDAMTSGCAQHGAIPLLLGSLVQLGWSWNSRLRLWSRSGLPSLHLLAGPIQHYLGAFHSARVHQVGISICWRQEVLGPGHVCERDKGLLRGVQAGGVWNGFLLGQSRGAIVPCRFLSVSRW